MTPLQKHAAFFDGDGDGKITLAETHAALRSLDVPWGWSRLLSLVINGALGFGTQGRATLTIDVANIAKGKHGNDTGVFGADGGFVDAHFERLFVVGAGGSDRITKGELRGVQQQNLDGQPTNAAFDFFSWAEATLFFRLVSDCEKGGQPAISKRRLRSFYMGKLLYVLGRYYRMRRSRRGRVYRGAIRGDDG